MEVTHFYVDKGWSGVKKETFSKSKACQQSVHLTLGILAKISGIFHALLFFWLDGFAVPAPAQVTQTVRRFAENQEQMQEQRQVLR